MKALIYRYGSICEPDVCETFNKLGFKVTTIEDEIYDKNLSPAKGIQILKKHLEKEIETGEGYTCIFTINFFPWIAEVANIYKILYFSLIVDSPVMELYSNSIRHPYNRIFLFDRCLYNEFSPQNPDNIFHTPLAVNASRVQKVISNASDSELKKYACDISFIGSLYSEKCKFNDVKLPEYEAGLAKGLIDAQLKIYGYNFIEECITNEFADKFLSLAKDHYIFPEDSRPNNKALVANQYISVKVAEQERILALKMLSEHFNVDIYTGSDTSSMPKIHNKGFAKTLTQMPLIFNQSKINLNITAKSIKSGLSLRIFDILGCGGFLLTNYQAELSEFFEIGVDLETYSSFEELIDKCDFYLKNDDARQQIAINGYKKVSQNYTWDTCLLNMFKASLKE